MCLFGYSHALFKHPRCTWGNLDSLGVGSVLFKKVPKRRHLHSDRASVGAFAGKSFSQKPHCPSQTVLAESGGAAFSFRTGGFFFPIGAHVVFLYCRLSAYKNQSEAWLRRYSSCLPDGVFQIVSMPCGMEKHGGKRLIHTKHDK